MALCDLPEDVPHIIISEVLQGPQQPYHVARDIRSLKVMRLLVYRSFFINELTRFRLNHYLALLCAKEIFRVCLIGKTLRDAGGIPPDTVLHHIRYLIIHGYPSHSAPIQGFGFAMQTCWDRLGRALTHKAGNIYPSIHILTFAKCHVGKLRMQWHKYRRASANCPWT